MSAAGRELAEQTKAKQQVWEAEAGPGPATSLGGERRNPRVPLGPGPLMTSRGQQSPAVRPARASGRLPSLPFISACQLLVSAFCRTDAAIASFNP